MSWITLFTLATSYRLSRCPYEIATQKYSQMSNIRPTKFPNIKCLSSSLAGAFAQFIDARCFNAGAGGDLYYISRRETSYGYSWPLCASALIVKAMAVPAKEKKMLSNFRFSTYNKLVFYYDAVLSEKEHTDRWNK